MQRVLWFLYRWVFWPCFAQQKVRPTVVFEVRCWIIAAGFGLFLCSVPFVYGFLISVGNAVAFTDAIPDNWFLFELLGVLWYLAAGIIVHNWYSNDEKF